MFIRILQPTLASQNLIPSDQGFLLDVVFLHADMKGLARFVCLLNHCYTSIV